MKLSMWHILQDLEDFQPEYNITDGTPRILGLHLHTRWDDRTHQGQYAYLELIGAASPLPSDDNARFTMQISNGPDTITVRELSDSSVLVNRLMALLANYNDWENRLRRAAGRCDLQEIVDIGTEKLNNPILLFDMQSNVLAMSAMFLDDDRNAFWNSCRDTRRVPIGYSAQSMTLESGEFASWTREPTLFTMPKGKKSIGNFICVEGEMMAGFALHEADNAIRPGDVYLVRLVEEMLAASMQSSGKSGAQHTLIQSVQDMLSGVQYEEHVYNVFKLPGQAPWRLVVIDNPYHKKGDMMYRQLLLPRLRSLLPRCLSMEYDNYVAVIAPLDDIDTLIEVINGGSEKPWFSICLSLPFDSLRYLHTRYQQTAFIVGKCGGTPGIYFGEDYALNYLALVGFDRTQGLIHPLLGTLKALDAQKNSDLYESLFQYLINERSVQKGAAALHVHKNTFSYRLDRIRELSNINLDDPMIRVYLLTSYVMDGALDRQKE